MNWWTSERSRNGGVDEVLLPDGRGRLWLCGKHFIGPDVESALQRLGATTVVCLNERYELAERYDDYVRWLETSDADRAVWFPIPDLHAPDIDAVLPFLDDLRARLANGDGLLMHCGAGFGRAGTMAAALLVTMGVSADDAMERIASHRPSAGPEAGVQRQLLTALDGTFNADAVSPPGE